MSPGSRGYPFTKYFHFFLLSCGGFSFAPELYFSVRYVDGFRSALGGQASVHSLMASLCFEFLVIIGVDAKIGEGTWGGGGGGRDRDGESRSAQL